jgi:hypothetical protein
MSEDKKNQEPELNPSQTVSCILLPFDYDPTLHGVTVGYVPEDQNLIFVCEDEDDFTTDNTQNQ